MKEPLSEILNRIGEPGSQKRIEYIASLNLGLQSEAAKRVCEKRYRRKELMDKGFSFKEVVLIVNMEHNEICS